MSYDPPSTEDLEKAIFYVKDEIKALLHGGAEREVVVAVSEGDLEKIVEAMPIGNGPVGSEARTKAWSVLRRLHDEMTLAKAGKI